MELFLGPVLPGPHSLGETTSLMEAGHGGRIPLPGEGLGVDCISPSLVSQPHLTLSVSISHAGTVVTALSGWWHVDL